MMMIDAARAALAGFAAALLVSGCGGGGNSGGGTPTPPPSTTAGPHVLFVSEYSTSSIVALPVLELQPGTSLAANVVASAPIGSSLAYDSKRDILYAGGGGAPSSQPAGIDVYEHASLLPAHSVPTRSILAPNFMSGESIFLDAAGDTIWFAGLVTNSSQAIDVFTHASTLSGTAMPDRVIADVDVYHFTVDVGRSILYILNHNSMIEVYPDASTLNGAVQHTRLINAIGEDAFAVDTSRDVLYMCCSSYQGGVIRLSGASTLGLGTPSDALPIRPFTSAIYSLVVDPAHDRLYGGTHGSAFILDGASTLAPGSPITGIDINMPIGTAIWSFAF